MPRKLGSWTSVTPGLLATVLALVGTALPQRAQAQTTEKVEEDETKELMRKGFAALKKNELESARASFADAWTKRHHFVIALSLAEVEMRLERYVDAAEHWQYVLATLPDDLAEKRRQAQEQLALCQAQVATLTFDVQPAQAAVYLDGWRLADARAKGDVYAAPGAHDAFAENAGHRSIRRIVHVPAGTKMKVQLVVLDDTAVASQETGATLPGQTAAPSPPLPKTASRTDWQLPFVLGGSILTVAAGTAGAILVVKSNAASDDVQHALNEAVALSKPGVSPDGVCSVEDRPEACDVAAARARDKDRLRDMAIASFIATGALAAATVATYWLWPKEKRSGATTMAPVVGRGFAGFAASGQF
jgi:hypothetical protein